MNRPIRSLLAWMGVAAILLSGCARTPVQTGTASPEVTIGLTYIPDIQFAPFYVAEQEGLFTEAGVDATLRHHGAQEGLFTALVAGQEDYVIAGGDEIIQARSQDMDLVAIAQYYHQYPVVLIVPEDAAVTSVADLAGQSIGIPGRYGESWFGLQAALAGAGLSEDDVSIVEIGYTAQAALTTGKVNAVVGFVNNDAVQFELAGVPTRTIPLSEDEVPLVSIVLATTRDNLDANPEAALKVAQAMIAGIEKTVAEPASAVMAAGAYIPTLDEAGAEASAMATLQATIPLWTPASGAATGALDATEWQPMVTFMRQAGIITTDVDVAASVDTAIVPG